MRTTSLGLAGIALGGLIFVGAGCATTPSVDTNTTADANVVTPVQPPAPPAPAKQLLVVLDQLNNSKQNGAALLTEENGKTRVMVTLPSAPKGSDQPAHIHLGACPAITAVKFSLNDVIDGTSNTLVESTFDQIVTMLPLSINVHKSTTDLKSYVACGELKLPVSAPVAQKDNTTSTDTTKTSDNTNTATNAPAPTAPAPAMKKFTVTAKQFLFSPSTIIVNQGDAVQLTVTSEDVDHGFAIPAFGVGQTIPAGKTITVNFTADKTGSFPFFCNVFCGSGHKDMKGTLVVK